MAYTDPAAFKRANEPGRGSDVGDFVPSKSGGWVPRDHPDAMTDDGTQKASAPSTEGAALGGGGGGGGDVSGLALGGLRSASQPSAPMSATELAAPGAANPALGQRLYPMAMRQLSLLAPRIY